MKGRKLMSVLTPQMLSRFGLPSDATDEMFHNALLKSVQTSRRTGPQTNSPEKPRLSLQSNPNPEVHKNRLLKNPQNNLSLFNKSRQEVYQNYFDRALEKSL